MPITLQPHDFTINALGGVLDSRNPAGVQPNRSPVIATIPDQTRAMGSTFSLASYFSDPDGDALTCTRIGGTAPAGVTVSTAGTVAVSMAVPAGNYTVGVSVDDGRGGSVSRTFNLTVFLGAPTGLSAAALSSSSIGLAWNAVSGATYKVYRNSVLIASPATPSYTDVGLAASTLYTYTVSAVIGASESAQSSNASATTQAVSGGSPLLNLTFDSGVDGTNIPELSDDSGTVYDSSQKYGASGKSAKIQITGGSGGFGQWGGIYSFPTPLRRYDEIWIRIRTRFPTGFNWFNTDGNKSKIKFIRLRNEVGAANAGYTDLYFGHPTTNGAFPTMMNYIHEAEQEWFESGFYASQMQPDTWHTYEAYYKLDSVRGSAGGQARARIWFDGAAIIDTNDRITLGAANATIPLLYLFTYWNQVAPQTQHGWIDDLTVYTGASPPGNFDGSGNRFIGV